MTRTCTEPKASKVVDRDSSAAIYKRMNDESWQRALPLLQAGAVMFRPSGMRDFYTWPSAGMEWVPGHCLTAARVKKLEGEGVLQVAGVDRYALNPDWSPAEADEVAQPDLFQGSDQ